MQLEVTRVWRVEWVGWGAGKVLEWRGLVGGVAEMVETFVRGGWRDFHRGRTGIAEKLSAAVVEFRRPAFIARDSL
jgi:hypothetical protein